jgi:hypothetical protein
MRGYLLACMRHRPIQDFEEGKNLRGDLNEYPRDRVTIAS